MSQIFVTACNQCPFADHDMEWGGYDCHLAPQEEQLNKNSITSYPIKDSKLIVPPDFCLLRSQECIVCLTQNLEESIPIITAESIREKK